MANEYEERKFYTLTPEHEENDRNREYLNTIDWAVKNKEINNIAISGSYGSGKSSLIKAFLKNRKNDKKNLEISVASFNTDYEKTLSSSSIDEQGNEITIENILEQYIMQQMFYSVSHEDIPNSRFSRIVNEKSKYLIALDIFLTLIAIFIVFIFIKYEFLKKGFQFLMADYANKEYVGLFVFILVFLMFFITWRIFNLSKHLKKLGLSRLELGSTAIEINPRESHSVFNKYIDEILYFFINTEIDLVVFEDIDRFESLEIFERLRDLNCLLNNNETIQKNKKKIVFIYAVRDDIFSVNDYPEEAQKRTKFFDFIIPTVKVLDNSNSEENLIAFFKEENEGKDEENQYKVNSELITDISFYINDMRVLKNICNELKIIKSALNQKFLDDSKLFAMIVYKNLHPKDYTDLLNGKGKLFDIFNGKSQYIKNAQVQLQEESKRIKKLIENIDKENAKDIKELHSLFLRRLNVGSNNYHVNLKGNFQSNKYNLLDVNQFIDFLEEIIKKRELNERIQSVSFGVYNPNENKSLNDFLTIDNHHKSILLSYESIKLNEENNLKEAKDKIESNNKEINYIESCTIKELYEKYKLQAGFLFGKNQLLKYLVINGWIAEDYPYYISYYYEGVLSQQDLEFIRAINADEPQRYNYPLTNPLRVFEKMSSKSITSECVYNFALFKEIFNNDKMQRPKWHENKVGLIREYLNTDNEIKTLEFINELIVDANNITLVSEILNCLVHSRPYVWSILQDNLNVNKDIKLKYLKVILEDSNDEDLNLYNSREYLSAFISNSTDFLSWNDILSITNWENKLNVIGVEFKEFDVSSIPEEIAAKILSYELYDINLEMLKLLLGVEALNYATLIAKEYIKDNVEMNLNSFVEVILEQELYNELEDDLLYLLNSDLDVEMKLKLINKWNGKFKKIEDIQSESVVLHLMKLDKLIINWKNIFDIIENITDEGIWEILKNIVFKEPYLSTLNNSFNENIKITYSKDLENMTGRIVKESNYSFTELDLLKDWLLPIGLDNEIDEEMVGNLIDLKLLDFESENFDIINIKYGNEYAAKYLLPVIDEILNGTVILTEAFDVNIAQKLLENLEATNLKLIFKYLIKNSKEIDVIFMNSYLKSLRENLIDTKESLEMWLNADYIEIKQKQKMIVSIPAILIDLDGTESEILTILFGNDSEELSDLIQIVINNDLSSKSKVKLLKTYLDKAGANLKIYEHISHYVLEEDSIKIGAENIAKMVQEFKDNNLVGNLLIKYFSEYEIDKEQDIMLLKSLKSEHAVIGEGGTDLKISDTTSNRKLIQLLFENEFVFKVRFEEDKICFDTVNRSKFKATEENIESNV